MITQKRLVSFLVFTGIAAVLAALTRIPFSWDWLPPEYCRLNNCYCEPFRPGYFVLQPQVALSNLGYFLTGLIILNDNYWRQSRNARHSKLAFFDFPDLFGVGLILAGLFSFFSHASLSRLGEWLDLMGVYLLGGLLVFFNLGRFTGISARARAVLVGAALLGGGLQMAVAPWYQQVGIAIFFGSAILLEGLVQVIRRPGGTKGLLFAALGSYVIGGLIWALGGGPACTGSMPWHAAWHLLSALAAGLLFWYYRSEPTAPRA